jgi:hypothetical protein
MLGGLARRATFVEQVRQERKGALLVDTGDLLFSYSGIHGPNAKKMGQLRADLYMKTYNLMSYDAFTPGELDLAFGVEEIIRMRKQARFPFLLANLIEVSTNQPVFSPYIVKNIRGLQVGLIGLISNQLSLGGPADEKGKYRLTDPLATGRKWVAELRKKNCQVIVVVAHMDAEEQEKLAQAVPGIHFILNGHYTHYQLDPFTVNGTKIFMAGSRGESMGQVDFFMEKKELHARYRLMPLTPKYPDHPETNEMLRQYKNSLQTLLQSQPPPSPTIFPPPSGRSVVIPVSPSYMGEKTCLPCHSKQHQKWAGSGHARAYQTLVDKGKADDPLCLACHTTGYGAPPQIGGGLKNVQCEACHGAAEGHPNMGRSLGKADALVCMKCHNSANSPNFNYGIYLQKIIHPQ